jgi:hypothetical protein
MDKEKVKLTARYVIIAFIGYMAYQVTSADFINSLTTNCDVASVAIGAVFGALTLVLKFHFDTKVDK